MSSVISDIIFALTDFITGYAEKETKRTTQMRESKKREYIRFLNDKTDDELKRIKEHSELNILQEEALEEVMRKRGL